MDQEREAETGCCGDQEAKQDFRKLQGEQGWQV